MDMWQEICDHKILYHHMVKCMYCSMTVPSHHTLSMYVINICKLLTFRTLYFPEPGPSKGDKCSSDEEDEPAPRKGKGYQRMFFFLSCMYLIMHCLRLYIVHIRFLFSY